MSTAFSTILARNIIHVSFGEDLSDEILNLKVKNTSTGRYELKSMTVREAIYVMIG